MIKVVEIKTVIAISNLVNKLLMNKYKNKTIKKTTPINDRRVIKVKDSASLYHQLEIGMSIVTETFPNTIDEFSFIINANMIINSFDFVSVNNLYHTTTIGIVKEVQSTFLPNQKLVSSNNDLNRIKNQDH
jgi:hypothetical protein